MRLNISIPKKLALGFGIIAIAIIMNSIFNYMTWKDNIRTMDRLDKIYEPSETQLYNFRHLVATSKMLIKNWVFIDEKANTPNKKALQKLITSDFVELRAVLDPLAVQWESDHYAEYQKIASLVQDSVFVQHQYVMNTLNDFEAYNNAMIVFEMMNLVWEEDDQIMQGTNQVLNQLDELIYHVSDEFHRSRKEMEASIARYKRVIFMNGAILLGFVMVIFFFSTYLIVAPLNKLKRATFEISKGNLAAQVDIKSGDELEILGKSFNQMARILKYNQTNLTRAYKKLQDSERELKISNTTKDKFFSIVSHDLRAPFSSLVSVSEVLAEDSSRLSPERKKGFIKSIHTTAVQLHNLIENLLSWSRTQIQNIRYEPSKVELYYSVQDIIDLIQVQSGKKNIFVVNNINENRIVYADKNLLSTILRNLISNAVKFTNSNGEVIISAEEEGDMVRLSVKDTGIGMRNEDIDMLFRVDVDTKFIGNSIEKGTGLGLILVKEFVEINGGTIKVESQLDKGSTFSFTLKNYFE
ncbi:MAG: HAMP domain-containing histidine kinase [Bacteroidales bacterium]|nr:HAMP domain-containing histidine kinase [Bacteroidales bacterium]